MAVNRIPIRPDPKSLTPLNIERIKMVVEVVNRRGTQPTEPGDIAHITGLTSRKAYEALDLAWRLKLITKEGHGSSCYYRIREENGPDFYDILRNIMITADYRTDDLLQLFEK